MFDVHLMDSSPAGRVSGYGSALLAAVEAVLKRHRPHSETMTTLCPRHALGSLQAKSVALGAFCDEVDARPDCTKGEHTVCAYCQCPDDEWPCADYRDISRELLREGH